MGKFKIINKTSLKHIEEIDDKNFYIPESDLTLQTNDYLIQFKFDEEDESRTKIIIKPGIFSLTKTSSGLILEKFELREYNLLHSLINTKTIMDEEKKFFNRLHIYKELETEPKRGVLLCSPPGVGKTATINQILRDRFQEFSEVMTAIVWDTSSISAQDVNDFFNKESEFSNKIERFYLIIEDVSGKESREYGGNSTNSSMLNLLDGVGRPFSGVPTFIIATTNSPEKEIGALVDRPGRFDKVIPLMTPDQDQCEKLLKHFLKLDQNTTLEVSDKKAMNKAAKNQFSIAHIQEVITRSKLDDISIEESVDQLIKHKKDFASGWDKIALKNNISRIGIDSDY
jgi:ATP-dependent 26S proteasome regulatory subunit